MKDMVRIARQMRDRAAFASTTPSLAKLLLSWAEICAASDQCEHRCGNCDNGMLHCNVHDCVMNPRFCDSQFCVECGFCLAPQDDKHGGPCAPCNCTTPGSP